jgi:anti-sigma B factor antagonist
MDIKIEGNKVSLTGRLDANTSPELEKEMLALIDKTNSITADLADLEYISSAGLRVFLLAHKTLAEKDGEMVLKNLKDEVKQVFDITGFTQILNIE